MDLHSKGKRARSHLERSQPAEAAQLFRELCGETHTIEPEYDDWLRGLAQAYSQLDRRAEAAYTYLYLQQFDDAAVLLDQEQQLHRARVLEQQGKYRAAAELYFEQQKLVLAAVAFERSAEDQRGGQQTRQKALTSARQCWERLRNDPRLSNRPYERALVFFNLGYCCIALEDEASFGHLVMAQRLLEEAADIFETGGLRERAFDCYQILLELGRRSGAFENLAEGYINCVRILKEDNLKYYALQYYEDFLRVAMEGHEYQAAASLYREVAEYCRRVGLIYDAHYLRASAETWMRAAEKTSLDGGSPEMAENNLLAAVECYNAVGNYQMVGTAYAKLSALELSKRKQERYRRIATQYSDAQAGDAEAPAFPEYLRQPHAYPEIWYLDLVEWEHAGDPAAVCALVVGDARYPEVVRRRALNVMLYILEGRAAESGGLAQVAEGLGDLQIYPVLGPLEALFQHPEPVVRRGVMRALRFLFFKRSFAVLSHGLVDPDAGVRQAAIEALGRLHFNHAFDPLVRIFRESEDPTIRGTALESLGRIPTLEAGDFLVEVLRHEPEELRARAIRLLSTFENRDFFAVLRQQYELESDSMREQLAKVLRLAGIFVG